MAYVFRGRLCGFICTECPEPLSNVRVRLYRSRPEQKVTILAVANPKDTSTILTDEQVKEKESSLFAETVTNDDGSFLFELDEKENYNGEAFEVDVYCGTVPGQKIGPKPPKPLQFTITTLQPLWRQNEQGFFWAWEYCLSSRFWCAVRALFGALVICGHVTVCNTQEPVAGVKVTAFDADWFSDDPLGSAMTDGAGKFRIDYTHVSFLQSIGLGALFPNESGPDVHFRIEVPGGIVLLDEPPARGRQADRQDVGACFCVELCTDKVGRPDDIPHWQRVEVFDIHPPAPDPSSPFSLQGYAGGASSSFVFGDSIALHGNCPLRNIAVPANALSYRFVIGEWTWPGGIEDPAVLPPNPPASLQPVRQVYDTLVGYVTYTNANGIADSADVVITSADVDVQGWITIDGKPITVDMRNGTTSTVLVSQSNFLRTFDLMNLNSNAISAIHPVKLPGGLPKSEVGRTLTSAEQEPIRRYSLQFEVRDSVTLAVIATDTLSSIIIDNSAAVFALDLEELRVNACNPVSGASNVHLLYTVDHPHLRSFSMLVSNNNGVVHNAPPLPNGVFAGNIFFRGAAGGQHQPGGNGGFAVNISGDPPCAYAVTLSWQTRRYLSIPQSTQILYCK